VKESIAGGDLFRLRIKIPHHLVGKPVGSLNEEGKILVAGVDRGGAGFVPGKGSTYQDGDFAQIMVHRDAMDLLDELLEPTGEQ
jgi:Trk K+ transport system NAD-binding subunit